MCKLHIYTSAARFNNAGGRPVRFIEPSAITEENVMSFSEIDLSRSLKLFVQALL